MQSLLWLTTGFDRSISGELSITFRLKEVVTLEEIKTKLKLHSHFWFEKRSKAGNLDRISGHTVYPMSGKNDKVLEILMKN